MIIDPYRKKFIAIFLIGLLFGFILGFIIGFEMGIETTIKKVVDVASGFVTINKEMVKQAIGQYSMNIKTCYPKTNFTEVILTEDGLKSQGFTFK